AHGAVFLEEIAVVEAPTAALAATLATAVLLDDDADIETHQRADVGAQGAVGLSDENAVPDAGETHRHLTDARIEGAGGGVDALEQFDLLGAVEHFQRVIALV